MKKSIYRLILEQKDEWSEFAETIGLENGLQQLAFGFAIGMIILLICGVGEWVHDLICGI